MKKIQNIKLAILFLASLFLCGCATLSYVGEDYNQNNTQTIKTNEDFIFNIYKKTAENANFKMGISKTSIPEILVLYVQVENLSYETPYVFRVENLRLYDSEREQQFINTSNYLNIYQTQEASSMSAMSSVGATIQNMTGMTANYNEYNQTMAQNASEASNRSAFSKMEQIGNQISQHSIKHSSTVSPRKSQYFYFFFENTENFPIKVQYKNLTYQFNL
ncbi:MAG: hypothetical protein IJ003_04335 [Candidatus Gastranaerophilales bacterium]|nr:hypothetical protein [Candidatus Gastranaerophilales bacterium]